MSALGEDGCDKMLQAASDRWERCDYGNIDVIDILRLVDLKHLNCAGKEEIGLSPPVPRRYFFCGSFCYFCRVFVMLLCAPVYCCLAVTCWEMTDILALVCDV